MLRSAQDVPAPSINFLFFEGMLLVALHPKCSASGDLSLPLSELILSNDCLLALLPV
jgi:hypothetical protein